MFVLLWLLVLVVLLVVVFLYLRLYLFVPADFIYKAVQALS